MRTIQSTSQFKRDTNRMKKRGKNMDKLVEVLQALANGEELASSFQDHVLIGQYKGTRECHIEPNWLLIYELSENELILIRTGSHSDLFE